MPSCAKPESETEQNDRLPLLNFHRVSLIPRQSGRSTYNRTSSRTCARAGSTENISKVALGTRPLIETRSRRLLQVIPTVARGILMASLGPREKQREAFKLRANTPGLSPRFSLSLSFCPSLSPTYLIPQRVVLPPTARTLLSVRFCARF